MVKQEAGEGQGGKLGALIDIKDFRAAKGERLLQGREAKAGVQAVGQLPREHVTAIPVYHRHQVEEALLNGHIDDVRAPNYFVVHP